MSRPPTWLDLLALGGVIGGCVALGVGIGWLVDDWLGTSPAFVLVGLAVGVVAAGLAAWARMKQLLQQ